MLEYVGPTQENLDFFRSVYDMSVNGVAFALFTVFNDAHHAAPEINRCLIINRGKVEGRCPLPEADLKHLLSETRGTDTARVVRLKNWQIIVEPMQKFKTLYCFGAGHVSKPTAHIAALVGFRVVVVDDRAEFANIERFPDAYGVLVIDDYNEAFKDLHIDKDSFIVIFTHSHLYDRIVLEQALKTDAGYIGMIASRRKRDSIYQALIAKGIRQEELTRVRSPIGLNIGAETPEEIAVSIVAELIRERSRKNI
jgi:xanthine dehydrogenase accessory factor